MAIILRGAANAATGVMQGVDMFGFSGWSDLGTGVLLTGIALSLAIGVLFLVAYIKILTRAGYSGWWVLILIVPIVNVVMILVFAFKRWPVQEELDRYRHAAGGYNTGGYPMQDY